MADEDLEDLDIEEGDLDEDGGSLDFDDPPPGDGGGKKKVFILIGLVLFLAIGGVAVAYFMGALDPLLGMAGLESGAESGDEPALVSSEFFPKELEPLTVNLNASGKKSVFLNIKVTLEFAEEPDEEIFNAKTPRLIDALQVYLRELRIEDLKGSAGMHRLRAEMLRRVNDVLEPMEVKDVLFNEMLVQ